MHPLEQAFAGELTQVAANRVLGQAEFLAQRLCHHPAVALQDGLDMGLPFSGQHACSCTKIIDTARYCMFCPAQEARRMFSPWVSLSACASTRSKSCRTTGSC